MAERTRNVQEIWAEVNRLLPQTIAGSQQNKVRHAVSYYLRGDYTTQERIALASALVERTDEYLRETRSV